MNTYMEGISDSTNNLFTKSELSGLRMDFMLLYGILAGLKAAGEKFGKIDAKTKKYLDDGNTKVNRYYCDVSPFNRMGEDAIYILKVK